MYENNKMLAGRECTLFSRHSRVQQPGSARLSGPTMFAHGQQTIFKSYVINKIMVRKQLTPYETSHVKIGLLNP
jgi:hypothetical protein